ncbi:hypothetical protein NQZ68_000071 [Dissostichus eleginoides]|nr:hypothetical protein NQZ68_000071 [Dissostichus eleginoides]
MLRAMLASWHCPRVNGQTLVNPTHSFSWDRMAQVAMETDGLWLPRGNKKRKGGGPQVMVEGLPLVPDLNANYRIEFEGPAVDTLICIGSPPEPKSAL